MQIAGWLDRDALFVGDGLLLKTPSAEPVLRSRLLPQISFRFLLGLMTVVAILSMTGRWAYAGSAMARALILGLAVPLVILLFGAVLFLFAWLVASVTLDPNPPQNLDSPFAEDQLPPQTLPPRDRSS